MQLTLADAGRLYSANGTKNRTDRVTSNVLKSKTLRCP